MDLATPSCFLQIQQFLFKSIKNKITKESYDRSVSAETISETTQNGTEVGAILHSAQFAKLGVVTCVIVSQAWLVPILILIQNRELNLLNLLLLPLISASCGNQSERCMHVTICLRQLDMNPDFLGPPPPTPPSHPKHHISHPPTRSSHSHR